MLDRFLLKIFSRGPHPSPKAVYAAHKAAERLGGCLAIALYFAVASGFGYMLALWLAGEASLR